MVADRAPAPGRAAADNVAYSTASRGERRFALFIAIALVALAAGIAPLGHVQAPEVIAFLPAVISCAVILMATTASLLFAQYRAGGFTPLAILGLGYCASAVLLVAYLLTFPRVFSRTGLLGAGPQSAAWLHVAWHLIFCLVVVLYVALERGALARPRLVTFARAAACIGALVACTIAATTLGQHALPHIHDGTRNTALYLAYVAPAMLGVVFFTNVFLIAATRLRARCHLWLSIVLVALFVETVMVVFESGGRYSYGWYFARAELLAASATFLVMLQLQYTAILRRVTLSNERLEDRNAQVEAFIALQDDMTAALPSREALVDVILAFAQRQTSADGCVMEKLDEREILYEAATGTLAPYIGTRLQRRGSLSGLSADLGYALRCDDSTTDERVDAAACARLKVVSMIVVPLAISPGVTVVLKVASGKRSAFDVADVAALQLIATHLFSGLRAASEFALLATAEREQRLYARQLRALHAIASTTTGPREQQIDDALRLGLEELGLDAAYFGVVEHAAGTFVIERSVGRAGARALVAGTRIPLERTLAYGDAPSKEVAMSDTPGESADASGYGNWGAHIAVPLYIAGTRYGAVGFTSRDARAERFSKANAEFLAVAGELIAAAIERGINNDRLADSEARYQALTDAMPQLVWILDSASKLEYVNARWSAYTGLHVEQNAAFANGTVVDATCLATLAAARAATPPQEFECETRMRRSDGTYRWHLVRAVPFAVSSGESGKWIMTGTDIEERKSAAAVLAGLHADALAATASKSRFLATMSHEIRTPMNGVIGMTELLLLTQLTDEQREFAKVVNDSGQSLLRLLNDILDYSKIEAGKLELEAIEFDVADEITSVVRLMGSQFQSKDITLLERVAPQIAPRVVGDPGRVRQILINLVGNALKFTPPGGSVCLSVMSDGDANDRVSLRFEVEDTGIGIPPDVVARLFRPFAQGDESTTRKYGGTGLGLSISAQLVALMDGTVGVESVPGKGSTFWFAIPFAPAAAPHHYVDSSGAPAHDQKEPCGPKNILLVEDNDVNRKLAIAQFARLGFKIRVAVNGRLAVEALRGEQFDLVFMDCHMPEMDGFAATSHIRALESGTSRRTPIVAMTADARREDHDLCLSAGMDDYISKPTTLATLRAALGRWLQP